MTRRREAGRSLPFARWPAGDRALWRAAFHEADPFDEPSPGAHLAPATRRVAQTAYAHWLRFLEKTAPGVLDAPAVRRWSLDRLHAFVRDLQRTYGNRGIARLLSALGTALRLIAPQIDRGELRRLTAWFERHAQPAPRRHQTPSSLDLIALGERLMDEAEAGTASRLDQAILYRDGLIIALLAAVPLRRRTFLALRLDVHLQPMNDGYALVVPGALTKTRQPLEFDLAGSLAIRMARYLERYRGAITESAAHDHLWPSRRGGALTGNGLYFLLQRHTRPAFGHVVSPHRFRHAAATTWAILAPESANGARDLLGHSALHTTEKHYTLATARPASRALADILQKHRRRPGAA